MIKEIEKASESFREFAKASEAMGRTIRKMKYENRVARLYENELARLRSELKAVLQK